ncbi:MAG TPA: hypothetical protein VMY37_36720 [Thermoguttaceae bacterium]|nr:hypothetical protein [Thermoguttaceae bacterium]
MPSDANRGVTARKMPLLGYVLLAYGLCASGGVARAQGAVPASAPAEKSDRAPRVESPKASAPTPVEHTGRAAGEDASTTPFPVPKGGSIPLLPLGRLVVFTNDAEKQAWTFATGLPSRSFVEQVRDPQGARHDAVSVYCYRAWDVVDGDVRGALVEFPLRLPPQSPVQLRAAMAFFNPFGQAGDKPLAEPVAWRVRVRPFDTPSGELGPILFAWNARGTVWQEAIVDLSDFAGQSIWLQLAVPPVRGNSHVFWVEPTLIAGNPEAP